MSLHHLTALRQCAVKGPSDVSLSDAEYLLKMLKDGDLIHVDEVPGYVAKVREYDPDFCFQTEGAE